MNNGTVPSKRLLLRICGGLTAAIGLGLTAGGVWLFLLGGPIRDFILGLALAISGGLLCAGWRRGAGLYSLITLAACAWAVWEIGFDGWALLPRTGLILMLLVIVGFLWPTRREKRVAGGWLATAAGVAGLGGLVFLIMAERSPDVPHYPRSPSLVSAAESDDWHTFGRTLAATRFAPGIQITTDNVAQLKEAWVYRSGDIAAAGGIQESEASPLKVGRMLYICTPHNEVIAVDAASGKERWRFDPRVDRRTLVLAVCRGVSYYKVSDSAPRGASRDCLERILEGTLDFRLIAVDAQTGRPCANFGHNGEVDLKVGFGPLPPNFVMVTSPPTIVGGMIVLGHMVMDNQRTDSPSGVVRAYDALSGEPRWAWDSGRPGDTAPVRPGQAYTLDTPNAWTVFAADATLGLVYVPTGGAPPDYYGGARRTEDEQFGSSIVALDVETGQVRWSFQTTHHDLWDYDLGAQPTLIDFPMPDGAVPALIQATKTGEIFVLDRRDGHPLTPVEERLAPGGAVPGDHTAPTQPFSVGMPSVGGADLNDRDMWGLTPIDQMICSLQFHLSNYRGRYTPPSVKPFIVLPGFAGGVDWGGVAVDTERGILIVNAIRLANRDHLVPRAEIERLGVRSLGDPGVVVPSVYPAAQTGTPFGVIAMAWLSPLGLPCHRPPWGTLTAIDLRSRQVLWSRPLGTTYDNGPLGIPSHIPAPAGVPNQGGSVVTAGGLTFIAASLDAFIRAFDTRTGEELWSSRLPAGGQANPVSYMLDGRQYVVVTAGGHGVLRTAPGDYLIAYALPNAALH